MTIKRPTLYPLPLIGWKELVGLPLLGVGSIAAKVDTGARTSALHAEGISISGNAVKFSVMFQGRMRKCSADLVDLKRIKSSNGFSELRPVIETDVEVGMHRFKTLVTLTDRADMGVLMLLGRLSIKGHFLVHPGRSFILSGKGKRP